MLNLGLIVFMKMLKLQHHCVGTCRMSDNVDLVLTPRLCLDAIDQLWVSYASIMLFKHQRNLGHDWLKICQDNQAISSDYALMININDKLLKLNVEM